MPGLAALWCLHLRGWMEASGADVLARTSLGFLAESHPLVFSHLGVLESVGIKELRLEISLAHSDPSIQCIFTSPDGGEEWRSRLARFW